MPNLKDDLASLHIDHSARAGSSRRGLWITVLIALVVVAVAGWAWTTRVDAIPVKTTEVKAQTGGGAAAGAVLNASGYVTARRRATVSSKVTGKVLEVFVEEGRAVQKGQVLAKLDDSQVRASLAVGEAQLETARRGAAEDEARLREAELTLGRREQLVKEQVISKSELDSARAEVESLKARIAVANQQIHVAESVVSQRRTDLVDMQVRAPFDGVAISKDAQPGEMISPVSAGGGFTRSGIATIVDMSSLEIEVDVNESYINRVHAGMPVEAVLDAYPDWRIPAHVIATIPSADRQKATVKVRIGFEQLEPRILPDMGVKVSFLNQRPTSEAAAAKPRLVVPKAAVRSADGRSIVFVMHTDRVERRAVSVGSTLGDQTEVLSGVNAGERVVIEGPQTLKDGDKVKVQ
ncbi:MAG: efflux RND transporter periplasmic adaptor subunit [Acidobacteria bacterium]|nr:efflux RND transporter periplasmic adaptor subunit [Acidobacteriota bacterium]